jgi:hypothetical protein
MRAIFHLRDRRLCELALFRLADARRGIRARLSERAGRLGYQWVTLSVAMASLLVPSSGWAKEIFVAKNGSDTNAGTAAKPFHTIQRAADVAQPGDVVTVRTGVYREAVDPARGGTAENRRIVYRAAPGEDVKIVGSERVTGWERHGYSWRAILPASFFGKFNPFATLVKYPGSGAVDTDRGWGWLRYGRWTHRGDVYFNGEGFTEVETEGGLARPKTWRAQVDENGTTTIIANFSDKDPNQGAVEVNVRPTIFYPRKPGLNYVTVRGFTMMNAAPYWAAPSPNQLASLGPNGGHHWLIEDNSILYSKATCISLGYPSGSADEAASGHHIVRNNVIMRCGQAGLVGRGWQQGSLISGNHIEDTNYRREFGGAETGAIKFHYAKNMIIEHNFIRNVGSLDPHHSNGDGIWLDVGAENVTIRNNVLLGVDANTFLMEANLKGPIYLENNVAVGGLIATYSSMNANWKNNLFVDAPSDWVNQTDLNRPPIQGAVWTRNMYFGTGATGRRLPADAGLNDERAENLYLGGAKPAENEQGAIVGAGDPQFRLSLDGPAVTASFVMDEQAYRRASALAGSGLDFQGMRRGTGSFAFGPFGNVRPGRNVMPLFTYSQRYQDALKALKCGVECAPPVSSQ